MLQNPPPKQFNLAFNQIAQPHNARLQLGLCALLRQAMGDLGLHAYAGRAWRGPGARSRGWCSSKLVANPLTIHESASRLHGLGRTITAPALGMRPRRDCV